MPGEQVVVKLNHSTKGEHLQLKDALDKYKRLFDGQFGCHDPTAEEISIELRQTILLLLAEAVPGSIQMARYTIHKGTCGGNDSQQSSCSNRDSLNK